MTDYNPEMPDVISPTEQLRMEYEFAFLCVPEELQNIVHIAPGNNGYVYGGATFSFVDAENVARAQQALQSGKDEFWLGKYAKLIEIRGDL